MCWPFVVRGMPPFRLTGMKPVPFTFDLEFKAADDGIVSAVELADGDLLIEGWGANYDLDREDEAFEDGAFHRGLKTFLAGNAPLCYHHDYKTVIGKVIDATPIAGKGIKVRAVVDHQPENSPWRHIYEGIKKGRINQFSCGGLFKRRMTESGPRIHEVDLLEWSATPVPVGRGTKFSVIAGKALSAPEEGKIDLTEDEIKVTEAAADVAETPKVDTPEVETPATEETPGVEADEEIEDDASALAPGSVTSDAIAPGAIGSEHLSDELRSRFSELKHIDNLSPEEVQQQVDVIAERLGKVFDQLGIRWESPPEGENQA